MQQGEEMQLSITFLAPWLCGSGKGAGRLYDATAIRDDSGFPYVPGRHLKGLLRHAVVRLSHAALDGSPISGNLAAEVLFGAPPEGQPLLPQLRSGCLRVSNGQLPFSVRDALKNQFSNDLENTLFMSMSSTAIERETGVALNKSLRVSQLAVPMELDATLTLMHWIFEDNQDPQIEAVVKNWRSIIKRSLPLVRAIGSDRNRGLGRCLIKSQEEALA
jgi:hypothetical protein